MFSGFNILDNQKPQDLFANLDLSSVTSSSLPYNKNEVSEPSNRKETQENVTQNSQISRKGNPGIFFGHFE